MVEQGAIFNNDTQITLNCSSQGGPMNNFTWFFGDTIINNSGDFSIEQATTQSSQLTVSNLVSGSTVNFTCQVDNEAGAENDTAIVQGRYMYTINFLRESWTHASVIQYTEY